MTMLSALSSKPTLLGDFTSNILLFGQLPANSWINVLFYIVLALSTIGFFIVLALQIKSFISSKQSTSDQTIAQKTWESIWTMVPLLVLIALWWLF